MEVLQQKLTYQEFREMKFKDEPGEFYYELINGIPVQKQSPTLRHQRISRKIERLLDAYALKSNKGEMLHAPLDVMLDGNNVYHPDIFFIKKERSFILDEKEPIVIGAPDLVVEILSKSTAGYDRGDKKDIYEKHGVREYWLVDPRTNTIEVYTIVQERYKLTSYLEDTDVLKSSVLEGFEMKLEGLF